MSGGRLVVLDRQGRDVKAYPLEEGLATIGSDPICDIRVMLPTVSPHHATVVVHTNQTVVRSASGGETLVNGAAVSVAALRHGDVLGVGGRALRWDYAQPARARPLAPQPALVRRAARPRARRRGSEPAPAAALAPPQRASMPAASGGKQVAIVQPQRRDTNEPAESSRNAQTSVKRPRSGRNDEQDSIAEDSDGSKRKSSARGSPRGPSLHAATRPRASGLRLSALRAAHRARHAVGKIRAPAHIDHTKQAAIMLMTGHTPKSKQSPKTKQPSYVIKKPSPVRRTPKQKKPSPAKKSSRGSERSGGERSGGERSGGERSGGERSGGERRSGLGPTPRRASSYPAARHPPPSPSILEITDSDSRSLRESNASVRSLRRSTLHSPVLPTPKKSALRDPSAKRNTRKTESIKFDLSNLESNAQDRSSDILFITETTKDNSHNNASADDLSLHYSDSLTTESPSPRKSIHSRSSRILEKSLGSTFTYNTPKQDHSNLSPESPHTQKSLRGSLIVQKALESSNLESSRYSRRTTRTVSEHSYSTTITSARKTLSPRSSNQNIESYSIVDLVSIGSNDSGRSVYNSADSNDSTVTFDTPQTVASRTTRSNKPSLLGSSTPYLNRTSSPKSSPEQNRSTRLRVSSVTTRGSAPITTPENSQQQTPFNSTRISKASRSRSRINDSDILLVEENEDSSPKSSRRTSKTSNASPIVRKNISRHEQATPASPANGTLTPTNRHSPGEATTPVLNIQSLLDQSALSQSSVTSSRSQTKTRTANLKRKTIGDITSQPKRNRTSIKSRSLNFNSRRSLRARKLSDTENSPQNQKSETPKSAVKLVQEAVKNKHSTAKKPTSKRSIIDNLDESDFVKQLFNSPVKRKLSQSMTEFSRKQLFEDDDLSLPLRPTRKTTALSGKSPENSLLNQSVAFPPEVFVSPLSTPSNSPNLSGMKRLFAKSTPENDLRNVRGVKSLLRTPRNRKSIKNDLSKVSGVKRVFARSPRNCLSDVRVKEVFAVSPQNDLRRVSGVKSLFQSTRRARTPKNTLDDLTGVKNLFRKSPLNDLQNVSGVKKTVRLNSPQNDLTDVRGVKQLYSRKEIRNDLSDLSGVEELFYESHNLDSTFDQLIGKPRVRSYTKSKSLTNVNPFNKQTRKTKSLHDSIGLITDNVEQWLENELKKRVHKPNDSLTPKKSTNKSNLTRELQKLSTNTIEGSLPVRTSRVRNGTLTRSIPAELPAERKKSASELYSAHTLPIKKRSLVANASGDEGGDTLPIKKRALQHSTPLRAQAPARLHARASPIARSQTQQDKESPTAKTSRTRTVKLPVSEIPEDAPKPTPRRTRAKVLPQNSPQQVRATRNKKINPPVTNSKKRRSSIIITKKPPAMSPKAIPKNTEIKTRMAKESDSNTSLKKTRSTRQKAPVEEKVKTPKKTRAKTNVKNISVPTMSPQPKVRATRQVKKTQEPLVNNNNEIKEPKRGRKAAENKSITKKTEVSKQERKGARNTATENKSNTKTRKGNIDEVQETLKSSRKNNQLINEDDKSKKRSKATQEKVEKQISVESDPIRPTRGRKAKDSMIVPETGKRQRKDTIVEEPKAAKVKSVEIAPRKTRRATKAVENVEPLPESANKEVVKKGKRGNKSTAETEVEAPLVAVGRAKKTPSNGGNKPGRKVTVVVEEVSTTATGRKRKTKIEESLTEAPRDPRRRAASERVVQRTTSRSRRR